MIDLWNVIIGFVITFFIVGGIIVMISQNDEETGVGCTVMIFSVLVGISAIIIYAVTHPGFIPQFYFS